jgi:hypothetical protein
MNRQRGIKTYNMNFNFNQINTETCYNGKAPKAGQECPENSAEAQECAQDDDFKIELFKLGSRMDPSGPASSLGYHIVTREMIQCLGRDKIKVHFEFGKRQELAGAETCFDHTPYITDSGKEDSIPFTVLDICNKANNNRKRCFLYSYQVTLHVTGPVDILPKLYTKITF